MLDLSACEWKTFDGGHRIPFDASVILRTLQTSDHPAEEPWNQIWNNLYHQGDVGIASYAALPWLFFIYKEKGWIDYHLPNFAYAVERSRQNPSNPMVPDWLLDEYEQAVEGLALYCLEKRKTHIERNFQKAVILLVAILMKEPQIADLIDYVEIGDEEKAIDAYYATGKQI